MKASKNRERLEEEHFIVTVMSPTLTEKHQETLLSAISESSAALHDQQLLTAGQCLKLTISGQAPEITALKNRFCHLCGELGADIICQAAIKHRHAYRLAVFDMDSTLIKAEVIDCLADAAGVGDQVAQITERAMRGELDFDESFRHRLGMLKGLDESVLQHMAETLPIMDGAATLITTLKSRGYKTAIISGGFTYFAEYLQKKLGLDEVHANTLDIIDGKVTGKVKGTIINGERKADILQSLADKYNVSLNDVMAVGDGANDLPMLSKAGLGIAFRAKPLVREQADHAISVMGLDSILHILGNEG